MRNWTLHQIRRVIDDRAGIIAYPTESVYGLGCHPLHPDAVQRILSLKHRDWGKGLILVASNLAQVEPYILPLSAEDRARLTTAAPLPTTWLLPARPDTPDWLTGRHTTLAVRISTHPTLFALCDFLNHPLVSTSANPSQRPPARTALKVRRYFSNQVDFILHYGGVCRGRPSVIRDLVSGKMVRV